MQFPYSWLKDYVDDLSVPAEELAHSLTMAGIAMENVFKPRVEFQGVVVGEIETICSHSDDGNLSICYIKTGPQKSSLPVVTRAPNVAAGEKVALAPEGAQLPGGRVNSLNIKGQKSEGVICSAADLNLSSTLFSPEQKDGVIILPFDTPLGIGLEEALGLDDVILELELTPNRADCLGLINIAREVAAVTGKRLRIPSIDLVESETLKTRDLITVGIESPELCGRYVARVVENVSVRPSPLWMQRRLQAAGIRPINNIVDITNYVMVETGQPLHAFDYHKINARRIIVRCARPGEDILTLDGVQRDLDTDTLVIADGVRPIGIAGVMGGLETEVTAHTNCVLLEAANFNQASIRRTSRKLGLRSEASSRFEKGVDIEAAGVAIDRAAQLIAELGDGETAGGRVDCYKNPFEPTVIPLRIGRLNDILGTELKIEDAERILQSLNFEYVVPEEGRLEVSIPSYRSDLTREVDLVEEVARLYGYNRIPTTLPRGVINRSVVAEDKKLEEDCRDFFVKAGLTEVITYSFIDSRHFDKFHLAPAHPWREALKIQNPLSEDQSVMRTFLLPGILEVASQNIKRKKENMAIFEIGKVFCPLEDKKLPGERTQVGGLATGVRERGWKWEPQCLDFFFLKGVLESLLKNLGACGYSFVPASNYPFLHPGKTAEVRVKGTKVAVLGEVHPSVCEEYGLTGQICVFWFELDKAKPNMSRTKIYRPEPKFPGAKRDLAVVVSKEIPASELEGAIREAGGELLREVELFDVYTGKQIPAGKKSMAYSLFYQSSKCTLKEEVINELHRKVSETLADRFGAELRE